ncbi:MAG: glycosyltransferase [Candidatus Margulisbacteria bacterium]|nr:glycosyltransferase [Candidatus Margulisiibacteriota bacterium]
MNILFVTNYFPTQKDPQAAIFLYWRAKELVEMGHAITVLKWNQDIRDYKQKPYNILDIQNPILNCNIDVFPYHSLDAYRPRFKNKTYQWIKETFDVVHFHWLWSMTVFPTIKQWDIPYVVTCHGSDIYRMGESFNNWALGRWINKIVMKNQMKRLSQAEHAIFVSTDIKGVALEKGATPMHSSVVPNGINALFHPTQKKQTQKVIVGYVGMLAFKKRADKLIEIFHKASKLTHIDQFLVIGEGPLADQMKADALRHELNVQVAFTGKVSVESVASYMQHMTILVLPSRVEGFGCVIKEAQACGVPVVGSSNGGIPEAIGQGGVVVEEGPNFEFRFATAIANQIEQPIDQERIKASVESYDWASTVKQEVDIYTQVISRHDNAAV